MEREAAAHACLSPKDPLSIAIACTLRAHMEAHVNEAQLFGVPEWMDEVVQAQLATRRWGASSDHDQMGLPRALRIHEEICTVSLATSTSRTVSLLALELLERIFPASILQDRAILSPGVRLTAANWAIMWLFAVHFAAKMYYDVRATRRFVDISTRQKI